MKEEKLTQRFHHYTSSYRKKMPGSCGGVYIGKMGRLIITRLYKQLCYRGKFANAEMVKISVVPAHLSVQFEIFYFINESDYFTSCMRKGQMEGLEKRGIYEV